jgi:purine-nucleoside phosphorylase
MATTEIGARLAINDNASRMSAPIGLQPTADLAERVLLPGDPARALLLAETLLEGAKMFNHYRGLWGYTGLAADDAPLTIQSTGMGGPSAAIVISELIDLGARRLVRVGTCGALAPRPRLGDLLVATEAIVADGTSRALGAGERVPAGPGLLAAVTEAAGQPSESDPYATHAGPVVSTDLFYDRRGLEREWAEAGALAVEMEAATLFTLAAARDVQAAALLVVSDVVLPARRRIGADELREAEARMGRAALGALSLARDRQS